MKKLIALALIFASTLAVAKVTKDGSHVQPDNSYPVVKMETSMGDIIIELDRRRAPITVNNFLRYVDLKSYDNTIFHRVIPGFVVQGGGMDTEFKNKTQLGAIFNESGNGLKNSLHTIAMARQLDPHTADRQFFFNVNDNKSLNPGKNWGYTVFGRILEGEDVVDAMSEVETEYNIQIRYPDFPVEPLVLEKAYVLDKYEPDFGLEPQVTDPQTSAEDTNK